MRNGLDKEDAEALIQAAMEVATKNGTVFKNSKQLSQAAMGRLNTKHLMGRKSQNGKKGSVVMTQAASERGDNSSAQNSNESTTRRSGTIYNIREGTIK